MTSSASTTHEPDMNVTALLVIGSILWLADLATLLRDLLKVSISGNLLNAPVGQQYDNTIGQLTRSQHGLRRSIVGASVENHPDQGKSLILFPSQIAG